MALGPDGANDQGALTNLLDSTAENFAGQGDQFHRTIKNLGKFTGTLENNKEELFGTAREMQRFVNALAENDQTVRDFNDSLVGASDLLEDEREDLAAALKNLGVAMQEVSGFVKENRDSLSENIKGLNQVSKILVKQRAALDETLGVAPLALSNLFHTYNPNTGTLDTRTNIGENVADLENNPALVLCSILAQTPSPKQACDAGPAGAAARRCPPAVEAVLGGVGRGVRRPVPRRHRGGRAMSHRTPSLRSRLARAAALVVVGATALTGCDFSVYSLPLPGGADLGDDPYAVTVQFNDVLDLVPQSAVKVDDVTVGRVDEVELDGYTAEVTVLLRKDVKLPDNAVAQIRQTSLLGEKFVSLGPPSSGASDELLGDGDRIPLERSGRNPEVEEVLGAMSLLLNGGGVAQLKTISTELSKALEGRETNVRSVLDQLDTFMAPDRRQQGRHHPGDREPQPAVGLAQQAEGRDHLGAGQHAAGARLHRPPARRPGQDAPGAVRPELGGHPGDPRLQGGHDQEPGVPGADADQAGRGRGRAAQVAPGVPHLPLRRRRGGQEPRPGPQPAHGRLHQPVGPARPRPAAGRTACRRSRAFPTSARRPRSTRSATPCPTPSRPCPTCRSACRAATSPARPAAR